MKLLAAGCSFVYGNELADATVDHHSNNTFTALLARHLELDYHCVAVPGAGNDTIARQVIQHLDHDTKLVVVVWSYAGRFEWNFQSGNHCPEWISLRYPPYFPFYDVKVKRLSRVFYAEMTEIYNWYNYVKEIVFLQEFLNSKKIDYKFGSADPDFNKKISGEDMVQAAHDARDMIEFQTLYDHIDWTRWFFWRTLCSDLTSWKDRRQQCGQYKNLGFREWTECNGFALGSQHQHPLEQAHAQTFKFLKELI